MDISSSEAQSIENELGIDKEIIKCGLRTRILRVFSYEDLRYIVFQANLAGYSQGTVVVLDGEGAKLVPSYPKPLWIFEPIILDEILKGGWKAVVEEIMNGYNTRVISVKSKIYAFLKNGVICPYTTSRLRSLYGGILSTVFKEYGEDYVIVGEIVGLENPYNRHFYPEYPHFTLLVLDLFRKNKLVAISERDEITDKYGLIRAPILALIESIRPRSFSSLILTVAKELMRRGGRKGIIIKDLNHAKPMIKIKIPYSAMEDGIFSLIKHKHVRDDLLASIYALMIIGEKIEDIVKEVYNNLLNIYSLPELTSTSLDRITEQWTTLREHFYASFTDERELSMVIEAIRKAGSKLKVDSVYKGGGRVIARFSLCENLHQDLEDLLGS